MEVAVLGRIALKGSSAFSQGAVARLKKQFSRLHKRMPKTIIPAGSRGLWRFPWARQRRGRALV